MSRWKIIPSVNSYFITTTVVEWQNILNSVSILESIIKSLKYCIAQKGLHLHAYVLMPNHAHYIVSLETSKKLSDVIRDFNRFTSRRITEELEETGRIDSLEIFHKAALEEGRGNRYKVWQDGFHPIAIESSDFFRQKIEYLHDNPVRKGFIERPEEWIYSSARNYILGDHSIIRIECME
jgi:putative transposase